MLSSEQLARYCKSSEPIIQRRRPQIQAVVRLLWEGMSVSLNRMRQGPNAKRTQGRGNGRIGGPRTQTNKNNGSAVRGNARQIMERYLALAREASSAGDRIAAEGYFQHAEHYYRQMTASGRDLGDQKHRTQPQPTEFEDQPLPDLGSN